MSLQQADNLSEEKLPEQAAGDSQVATPHPDNAAAEPTAQDDEEPIFCEHCIAAGKHQNETKPTPSTAAQETKPDTEPASATAQETTPERNEDLLRNLNEESVAEPATVSQADISSQTVLIGEQPSYQALPEESACHWATAPVNEPAKEQDAKQKASLEPSNTSLPFSGKVALITGSGRGMGRGIALELARRGCSIVVNYSSSAAGAEKVVQEVHDLMTGAKAIALRADVSKPAEIRKLFDDAVAHFGHLDIVVSNSGKESWKDELEVTQEDFDDIFNVNCRGQFFVAQQGMKHLPRGGRIILMSSIAATSSHVANHALYSGSKAAVEGFTRSFAIDCGPKGITCNAIAPGGIKTEMFDANAWHYAPGGTPDMPIEKIDAGIASACPLGRVGMPADIGRAVSLLASPESEWINGQIIALNGGGI